MPEAMPDTTGMPLSLNALPKSLAIRIACGVSMAAADDGGGIFVQ